MPTLLTDLNLLDRAPMQVKIVARRFLANAKEVFDDPKSAVCVHFNEAYPPEWLIGSNYDQTTTLVYHPLSDMWYVRDLYTGVDTAYDLERALSDASTWFTD